jgi:hypothetical protein
VSTITKGPGGPPKSGDEETKVKHGVPKGAAQEESHGGYGGTDRLQSETAPLHPDASIKDD